MRHVRRPDSLTGREREVLELLRRGLTNEEIAQRLGISRDGAKYHVSQILGKFGVESRAEASAVVVSEWRPWWMSALLWLKVGGAATVTAAAAGVALLAWGAVRTGGPADEAVILLDLPTPPVFVSAGAGSIWVLDYGTHNVSRVHPQTGEVLASIAINPTPGSTEGIHDPYSREGRGGTILATDDAVWVLDTARTASNLNPFLWRIDPATNEIVARLDLPFLLGGEDNIVEAFGSLWVASFSGFTRIDPDTNAVIGPFDLGNGAYPAYPGDIVAASEAVWFSRFDRASESPWALARVNPETNQIEDSPLLLGVPVGTADGLVWVYDRTKLVALDAASNEIVRTLDTPAGAGTLCSWTIAGDTLWAVTGTPGGASGNELPPLRTGNYQLVRFDLASGESEFHSDLFPFFADDCLPLGLTAAYGSLWVGDFERGNLLRIDIED